MARVIALDRKMNRNALAQSVLDHAQAFCRQVGCTLEEYLAMVESANRLWPLLSAAIRNPRLLDRADVRRVLGMKEG